MVTNEATKKYEITSKETEIKLGEMQENPEAYIVFAYKKVKSMMKRYGLELPVREVEEPTPVASPSKSGDASETDQETEDARRKLEKLELQEKVKPNPEGKGKGKAK